MGKDDSVEEQEHGGSVFYDEQGTRNEGVWVMKPLFPEGKDLGSNDAGRKNLVSYVYFLSTPFILSLFFSYSLLSYSFPNSRHRDV